MKTMNKNYCGTLCINDLNKEVELCG